MCPNCGEQLIPIHYGKVEHSDIQKVIYGVLYIGEKYHLEKFYCKLCKQRFREDEV